MAEQKKATQAIEDFDWEEFENGGTKSAMSKEEEEKAYSQTLSQVNTNEVVEGTVISMNKREVVVNIGYKSDGIVSMNEFRYNPDLKLGDKVELLD